MRMTRQYTGKGLDQLVGARPGVEAQDAMAIDRIGPDRAVPPAAWWSDHRLLGGRAIERGRQAPDLESLALGIKLGDAVLEHQGEPERAVRSGLKVEGADRGTRLEQRDRILGHLASGGIEHAELLLAELTEPDPSGGIAIDV